jgi:outer membrane receptor protein involved in Fe transport
VYDNRSPAFAPTVEAGDIESMKVYTSGIPAGRDDPAHLPPNSRFDLSISKAIREKVTVFASAVNIANTRYLLGASNTFGGAHCINPRQVYGEVRYRFYF